MIRIIIRLLSTLELREAKNCTEPPQRGYRPVSAILIISFIVLATIGAFAFVGPDDCAEVSGESNDTTGGDCGTNLHWRFDDDTGELTIYGSGEMTDYTQRRTHC